MNNIEINVSKATTLPMAEMVKIYNEATGKSIKKFENKVKGAVRLADVLESNPSIARKYDLLIEAKQDLSEPPKFDFISYEDDEPEVEAEAEVEAPTLDEQVAEQDGLVTIYLPDTRHIAVVKREVSAIEAEEIEDACKTYLEAREVVLAEMKRRKNQASKDLNKAYDLRKKDVVYVD